MRDLHSVTYLKPNPMLNPLKYVTFNVKGLNSPIKRKIIYTYLKKLKADIVFYKKHILQPVNTRN